MNENKVGRYSCDARLLWLAAFVISLALSAFGQANQDQWLILPNGRTGAISAHTTRRDLVRMYGSGNVTDEDVSVGEGETEPGTIVFAKDPQRKIEILWKGPEKTALPASVQIAGTMSKWKTVHDISLGTSLKDLQRLNTKPFKLAGFGWDYSGTVTSWENGALQAELDGGHGKVWLRLDYSSSHGVTEKEVNEVQGDRDFSSDHPVMGKLNPVAYQMIIVFPSPTED